MTAENKLKSNIKQKWGGRPTTSNCADLGAQHSRKPVHNDMESGINNMSTNNLFHAFFPTRNGCCEWEDKHMHQAVQCTYVLQMKMGRKANACFPPHHNLATLRQLQNLECYLARQASLKNESAEVAGGPTELLGFLRRIRVRVWVSGFVSGDIFTCA